MKASRTASNPDLTKPDIVELLIIFTHLGCFPRIYYLFIFISFSYLLLLVLITLQKKEEYSFLIHNSKY